MLNDSLDYDDDGLDARPSPTRSRRSQGICTRTSSTRSEVIAATARRLPDVQPSKVGDGDHPNEEDQQ